MPVRSFIKINDMKVKFTINLFSMAWNNSHQLKSEIIVVHRCINMVLDDDGYMIPRDECDLNFLAFIL